MKWDWKFDIINYCLVSKLHDDLKAWQQVQSHNQSISKLKESLIHINAVILSESHSKVDFEWACVTVDELKLSTSC